MEATRLDRSTVRALARASRETRKAAAGAPLPTRPAVIDQPRSRSEVPTDPGELSEYDVTRIQEREGDVRRARTPRDPDTPVADQYE